MTDSIDIDDLGIEEESTDEEGPNRGDWFWKGDSDPDDEPGFEGNASASGVAAADSGAEAASADDDHDRITAAPSPAEAAEMSADGPTPRVPRQDDDRPVGIPKAAGGSGGVSAKNQSENRAELSEKEKESASGPHGGGADDMTTAFTLNALQRLENLQLALSDTNQWSDWIGIVGDVNAHVINKFQRDNQIDADFFNGTGTGPGERLADIDTHSMFYSKRMVVIGCDDEEWIAEEADWEFVPLEDAAEGADWDLTEE